eukprot:TRINITY_DN33086_c0_g1_i1.p1 TRINITY_DN33086_c0_g1~~TRINITY_DN33086_c0_g1_i1.p1  ORF type:complete len:249 (-),score=44.33 TRINITY_DN33086_c0_g1_i1:13-759(-)
MLGETAFFLGACYSLCSLVAADADRPVAMLEHALPLNASAADRYRQLLLPLLKVPSPGRLHFDVYEDVDPATSRARIWQYLVFESDEAHHKWMSNEHVTNWVSAITGLLENEHLSKMRMTFPEERPLPCLKEAVESPYVVLVQMYTEDPKQYKLIEDAAIPLLAPTRSEAGCVYYDQLVPDAPPGTPPPYVQEVLWFKDKAAHEAHMQSQAVKDFVKATAAAKVGFSITKPHSYSMLPKCSQEHIEYV